MFEFIFLFILFYFFFTWRDRSKKAKRSFFKRGSLDQELAELMQAEDNSTGIALSVKAYLLDVLADDKNDLEKYSDDRLAQAQQILDKAGPSALYFMADIAAQLSLLSAAHINGIPTQVSTSDNQNITPEYIINSVIKI